MLNGASGRDRPRGGGGWQSRKRAAKGLAMPQPDNTYRLVVFDHPDDPQAVRDLMCGVTGIHPTDAMQWVARRAPGIWPQPLAEGEVRELLDGLYDLGVPAEAWRIDKLPDLNPVRTIHDASCLE